MCGQNGHDKRTCPKKQPGASSAPGAPNSDTDSGTVPEKSKPGAGTKDSKVGNFLESISQVTIPVCINTGEEIETEEAYEVPPHIVMDPRGCSTVALDPRKIWLVFCLFAVFLIVMDGVEELVTEQVLFYGKSWIGKIYGLGDTITGDANTLPLGINANIAMSLTKQMDANSKEFLKKTLKGMGVDIDGTMGSFFVMFHEKIANVGYWKIWWDNFTCALLLLTYLWFCIMFIMFVLHYQVRWLLSNVVLACVLWTTAFFAVETNYAGCYTKSGSFYWKYYPRDEIIGRFSPGEWVSQQTANQDKCASYKDTLVDGKINYCITAFGGVSNGVCKQLASSNCQDSSTVDTIKGIMRRAAASQNDNEEEIGKTNTLRINLNQIETFVASGTREEVKDEESSIKIVCKIKGTKSNTQGSEDDSFDAVMWFDLTNNMATELDKCANPDSTHAEAANHFGAWFPPPLPGIWYFWSSYNANREKKFDNPNFGNCISFGGHKTVVDIIHDNEKKNGKPNQEESRNYNILWYAYFLTIFLCFVIVIMTSENRPEGRWTDLVFDSNINRAIIAIIVMGCVIFSRKEGSDFNITGWKLYSLFIGFVVWFLLQLCGEMAEVIPKREKDSEGRVLSPRGGTPPGATSRPNNNTTAVKRVRRTCPSQGTQEVLTSNLTPSTPKRTSKTPAYLQGYQL